MDLTLALLVWMISCVHDAALKMMEDGYYLVVYIPCTGTTSPIQCTNTATDGPTDIALQRVDKFNKMELVYHCDNGPTDIIIANIIL